MEKIVAISKYFRDLSKSSKKPTAQYESVQKKIDQLIISLKTSENTIETISPPDATSYPTLETKLQEVSSFIQRVGDSFGLMIYFASSAEIESDLQAIERIILLYGEEIYPYLCIVLIDNKGNQLQEEPQTLPSTLKNFNIEKSHDSFYWKKLDLKSLIKEALPFANSLKFDLSDKKQFLSQHRVEKFLNKFLSYPEMTDIQTYLEETDDPTEKKIKEAILNIPREILKKIEEYKDDENISKLLEISLTEAFRDACPEDFFNLVAKSPLYLMLCNKFNLYYYTFENAINFEFTPEVESIDDLIRELTDYILFEKICSELETGKSGCNIDDLITQIRDFLTRNPHYLDFENATGNTFLVLFIKLNKMEGIKMLVEEFKSDVNHVFGKFHDIPLIIAAKSGNLSIYKYLVANKANEDQKNDKGICAKDFLLKRGLKSKWEYSDSSSKSFNSFGETEDQLIQKNLQENKLTFELELETKKYTLDLEKFTLALNTSDKKVKDLLIRNTGYPSKSMFFLKGDSEEEQAANIRWQILISNSRNEVEIFDCGKNQNHKITAAFLRRQREECCECRFDRVYEAKSTDEGGRYGEKIESNFWVVNLNFETFMWNFFNADKSGEFRWVPLLKDDVLIEPKSDDLGSTGVTWQYIEKSDLSVHSFNQEQHKKLNHHAQTPEKEFKMSDMDSEIEVNFSDYTVLLKNSSGEEAYFLRYIGPFLNTMHIFSGKKKDENQESIEWVLHFKYKDDFQDYKLPSGIGLILTKNYFSGKSSCNNLMVHFPWKMTFTSNLAENYGTEKSNNSWALDFNLQKFTFCGADTNFEGLIRWVPAPSDDVIEKLLIEDDISKRSEDDEKIETEESNGRQIENILNPPPKKAQPEDEIDENTRIFHGKADLVPQLEPYFDLNPEGNFEVSPSGKDLIVHGSPKYLSQVEKIINLLTADDENEDSQKKITHTFHKRGHLADIISDFMICKKSFTAEQDGENLKVRVTSNQLVEILPLIEALIQTPEDIEKNKRMFDRRFEGAVFFAHEIKKGVYNGEPVVVTESGKNLIVSGTLSQLGDVKKDIEGAATKLKQNYDEEEFTVEEKGHLLEVLKAKFRDEFRGFKIAFSAVDGDLKIKTYRLVYEWIADVIPVIEAKLEREEEKKRMEDEVRMLESGQDKSKNWHLRLISKKIIKPITSYFSRLAGTITDKKKLDSSDLEITLRPSLVCEPEGDNLNIIFEEANEKQFEKFKGEVKKVFDVNKLSQNIFHLLKKGLKDAKDWSKTLTSMSNLEGEKKRICKEYQSVYTPMFEKEFKSEEEKVLNVIVAKTNEMYKSNTIDCEKLKESILAGIGNKKEFKSDDLSQMIVNKIKEVAMKAANEFIEKMKEDAIRSMLKELKIISEESKKTLKDIISEKVKDMRNIIIQPDPVKFYDLLYRIYLFIQGFKINLPIFTNLPEIFEKLDKAQILLVKVSTGSGKSTLIPPLLLAEGYQKIVVTQPRRLPCRAISNRVNKTFHKGVSGWSIAGQSQNTESQLTYMTDGLLKEVIMYSEYDNKEFPYTVVMLDEIHERGKNIDLCLATLSLRLQTDKKLKLILCSATIDESILKQFPGIKIEEFVLSIINPHIKIGDHGGKEMLGLAAELSKKLKPGQKILCFLPSVKDVKEACETFSEKYNRMGYPLIANQPGNVQEEFLEEGQVFFSTTIAETSITFPGNLCYVIDSGKIRSPFYDAKNKLTYLREFNAAESTLTQRKGRLGRTNNEGKYILMNPKAKREPYPLTELEQIDLTDTYFGVLRATNGKVKETNKIFEAIPTKDRKEMEIKRNDALNELKRLGIIDKDSKMTDIGMETIALPIRGSAKMCKAVHTGITKYKCGKDMILLAAAFVVLDQGLQGLIKQAKSFTSKENGDFETLLKLLRALLKKVSESKPKANYTKILQELGLGHLNSLDYTARLMQDVVDKFNSYMDDMGKSDKLKNRIPKIVHLISLGNGNWEPVGRSLVSGFFDQTFVNSSYLGESEDYYLRLMSNFKPKVMLSSDSALHTGFQQTKIPYIIAKDILFAQFEHVQEDFGNISVVGKVEPDWLTHDFTMTFSLDDTEIGKKKDKSSLKIATRSNGPRNYSIIVSGQAGIVVEYEHDTINSMRVQSYEIDLESKITQLVASNKDKAEIYTENFKKIKDDNGRIFRSIFKKWEKQAQTKMSFRKTNGSAKIEINNARQFIIRDVEVQMTKFIEWFKNCNEINCQGIKGYPFTLDKHKVEYKPIRDRIERITNPAKDLLQLKNYATGPNASRVTRMELVCWILINNYDCTVEGGFIRDWVVAGNEQWKDGTKLKLINNKWDFDFDDQKNISPKDLDVHLSMTKPFDKEKFQREITKLGLTVEFDESDGWRTYCVFDKDDKWPFTADLIEPYQQVCQDTVDMDISNLYVKGSYTGELGLRIPLDNLEVEDGKSTTITVDMIIQNIQKKVFTILRPRDTKGRIKKFEERGWKQNPVKFVQKAGEFSIDELKFSDPLYKLALDKMSKMAGARIQKVYVVGNKALDKIYEGQRDNMMKANKGEINETLLYHGTSAVGADGIIRNSFDNRYAKDGAWGFGFYFADDPNKSHGYAPPDANGVRNMLLCKVLLGKKNNKTKAQNGLHSAEIGFDSVIGTGFKFTEYIVYRHGQAKPFIWIQYK